MSRQYVAISTDRMGQKYQDCQLFKNDDPESVLMSPFCKVSEYRSRVSNYKTLFRWLTIHNQDCIAVSEWPLFAPTSSGNNIMYLKSTLIPGPLSHKRPGFWSGQVEAWSWNSGWADSVIRVWALSPKHNKLYLSTRNPTATFKKTSSSGFKPTKIAICTEVLPWSADVSFAGSFIALVINDWLTNSSGWSSILYNKSGRIGSAKDKSHFFGFCRLQTLWKFCSLIVKSAKLSCRSM